jgi:hypothetical protein
LANTRRTGSPEPLSDSEFAYWEAVSEEILERI